MLPGACPVSFAAWFTVKKFAMEQCSGQDTKQALIIFTFIITDADKICVNFPLTQILYRMMYTGVIKALEENKWYSKKQQRRCFFCSSEWQC